MLLEGTPIPFDEGSAEDKFWKEDPYDRFLPKQRGFITDSVFHCRGTEIPTIYTIWSALFAISSVVKREAWIKWPVSGPLYGNLYVILVGPPSSKKNSAIGMFEKMMVNVGKHIKGANMRYIKQLNIIRDRATPEAVVERMKPCRGTYILKDEYNRPLRYEDGDTIKYKPTSESAIIAMELSVLFNKQKYNESSIQTFIDLYDTKDISEVNTKKNGKENLYRLYTTLIGGTTPDGFRDAIPRAAIGDGFLSRTIIVYLTKNIRRFSMPRITPGAPTEKDLNERLAWIAEHTLGEHVLSDEAFVEYNLWYEAHKDRLDLNQDQEGMLSRMDINVLKLSMLMKAQRYGAGNVIELQDFKAAVGLMNATYKASPAIIREVSNSDVEQHKAKLCRIILRHKECDRKNLLQKSHIQSKIMNELLNDLSQEGLIEIYLDDKKRSAPSKSINEVYKWIGDVE